MDDFFLTMGGDPSAARVPRRLRLAGVEVGDAGVCMLFISTVDQPVERVTIYRSTGSRSRLLLAVAPAQAGRAWGEGDISVA